MVQPTDRGGAGNEMVKPTEEVKERILQFPFFTLQSGKRIESNKGRGQSVYSSISFSEVVQAME